MGLFSALAGYIIVINGLAANSTARAPVLNDICGKAIAPIG
jgi:succinate-acetate transporter protein